MAEHHHLHQFSSASNTVPPASFAEEKETPLLPSGMLDWGNQQSDGHTAARQLPGNQDFSLFGTDGSKGSFMFQDLHKDEVGGLGKVSQETALKLLLEASARLSTIQDPHSSIQMQPRPMSQTNSPKDSPNGSFHIEGFLGSDFNMSPLAAGAVANGRNMMHMGGLDVNSGSANSSGPTSPSSVSLSPSGAIWGSRDSPTLSTLGPGSPSVSGLNMHNMNNMNVGTRMPSKLCRDSGAAPHIIPKQQQQQQFGRDSMGSHLGGCHNMDPSSFMPYSPPNSAPVMGGQNMGGQNVGGQNMSQSYLQDNLSAASMSQLLEQLSAANPGLAPAGMMDSGQGMPGGMANLMGMPGMNLLNMNQQTTDADIQQLAAMVQMLQHQQQATMMGPGGGMPNMNMSQIYLSMLQAQAQGGLGQGGFGAVPAPAPTMPSPDMLAWYQYMFSQGGQGGGAGSGPSSPHPMSRGQPTMDRMVAEQRNASQRHSRANSFDPGVHPGGLHKAFGSGEGGGGLMQNNRPAGVRDIAGSRSLGGSFSHSRANSPSGPPGGRPSAMQGSYSLSGFERSQSFTHISPREREHSPGPTLEGRSSGYGENAPRHRSEAVSDPLLQELRSGRNLELAETAGHLVAFALDQHGSRFVQQKLAMASPTVLNGVLAELQSKTKMIAMDIFGNYIIQKLLDVCNAEQRRQLADGIRGHVICLSLHCYGCRVVQKALEVLPLEWQCTLLAELDGQILRCARDQNGNHVVQKVIEYMPMSSIGHVLEDVLLCAPSMSCHPFGSRVIQRVLEKCPPEEKIRALATREIVKSACSLAQDQFGNYVLQHVLEYGTPAEHLQVAKELACQMLTMSTHKFASNVVEKCMILSRSDERDVLINSVIEPFIKTAAAARELVSDSSNHSEEELALQIMMKDPYGNYVVRKMMELCAPSQLEVLMDCLMSEMRLPHRSPLVTERLEKLAIAGGRLQAEQQSATGSTSGSAASTSGLLQLPLAAPPVADGDSPAEPVAQKQKQLDLELQRISEVAARLLQPNVPARQRQQPIVTARPSLLPLTANLSRDAVQSAFSSNTSAEEELPMGNAEINSLMGLLAHQQVEDKLVDAVAAPAAAAAVAAQSMPVELGALSTADETQPVKVISPRTFPGRANEDELCVICWEGPRESGFMHGDSAHVVACRRCVKGVAIGAPCPMCREPVEHVLSNIFKS